MRAVRDGEDLALPSSLCNVFPDRRKFQRTSSVSQRCAGCCLSARTNLTKCKRWGRHQGRHWGQSPRLALGRTLIKTPGARGLSGPTVS
eukprot:9279677-Pyramimonas_sp.AAC.2